MPQDWRYSLWYEAWYWAAWGGLADTPAAAKATSTATSAEVFKIR